MILTRQIVRYCHSILCHSIGISHSLWEHRANNRKSLSGSTVYHEYNAIFAIRKRVKVIIWTPFRKFFPWFNKLFFNWSIFGPTFVLTPLFIPGHFNHLVNSNLKFSLLNKSPSDFGRIFARCSSKWKIGFLKLNNRYKIWTSSKSSIFGFWMV